MKKDVCLACGFKFQKYKYFNKYFEESYLKSIFVNNYGKKYYKILASSNFKIAVLTKFHMNYLIDLGFDKNRIEIVPNYIDDYTVSVNVDLNKNFVYAGRISNEKGVKELIDAFNELNYEGVKLQIIGDGPLLSTLVKNNRNSNIEFYGQMNNKEVKELIKKSLAVVTATKLLEGQPTILHEASLLKKPSVYPNTGGLREFFPKNNTLSFEQFNYTDLMHKMSLLLNNFDEALNLGEENYNFITENFSKQKILDKYTEIFN
jgi:glycosyltransferase involved in cell wall biosynthesis